MSFFENIKRVLGLSDEYEEEEFGIDATVKPLNDNSSTSENNDKISVISATEQPIVIQPVDFTEKVPIDVIFNHVLEIFNKALPDFLSSTVDPEAQKKYLFDTLDTSVKEYITNLSKSVAEETRRQWKTDREKIQAQLLELTELAKKSEEKINEAKSLQLSAERQKRTFAERVHDLENQIGKLEADREQLQLENRSLINKVKVNSVQEGDMESLRNEIATLQQQLRLVNAKVQSNDNTDSNLALDDVEKRIAELQAENDALRANNEKLRAENEASKADNDKLIAENDAIKMQGEALVAENETLKAQNATLVADNEALKAEIETHTANASQYNNTDEITINSDEAAETTQQLKQKQQECEELKVQIEVLTTNTQGQEQIIAQHNATIQDLQTKLDVASEQAQAAQKKLDEAQQNLAMLDEIQTMIEQFEVIKEKKDRKIAELTALNDESAAKIDSLQRTITQNLSTDANEKDALVKENEALAKEKNELLSEISNLRAELERTQQQAAVQAQNAVDSQVANKDSDTPPDIPDSNINSLIDTDWLYYPSGQGVEETQEKYVPKRTGGRLKSKKNNPKDDNRQLSFEDFG